MSLKVRGSGWLVVALVILLSTKVQIFGFLDLRLLIWTLVLTIIIGFIFTVIGDIIRKCNLLLWSHDLSKLTIYLISWILLSNDPSDPSDPSDLSNSLVAEIHSSYWSRRWFLVWWSSVSAVVSHKWFYLNLLSPNRKSKYGNIIAGGKGVDKEGLIL